MEYELRIQDPTNPPRSPLLDELVDLAGNGQVVWLRMFFGFLTGSGVDTLLGYPKVRKVLHHSKVDMLVGLDAVTDRPGLERLLELAKKNPRFKPRVIQNTTGALIHPKMLAAQYTDGRAVAVVGSNNLTLNGLSGNVEGYTIARFEPPDHLDLTDWDEFIRRWGPQITKIDNKALAAADQNVRRLERQRTAAKRSTKPGSGVVVSDGQAHEIPASEVKDLAEPILVAQIPRAGGRWPQVHYSAKIIQDFFAVKAGQQVFLRELNSTNVEEPQVVYSEANKNYKIELGAAREAEKAGGYPAKGRPVVLFRRESSKLRRYRYVLLMPKDVGHDEMAKLAKKEFKGPAKQVPRVIVPRSSVLKEWPGCPL